MYGLLRDYLNDSTTLEVNISNSKFKFLKVYN